MNWWIFTIILAIVVLIILAITAINKAEKLRYMGFQLTPKNLWEKLIVKLFLKDRLK